MSRRRSHPPRARKARNPESEAPQPTASSLHPAAEVVRDTSPPSLSDELAELDAGWNELIG